MHQPPTLFPFIYATEIEEVLGRLAEHEAEAAKWRAFLHDKMKWRARFLHANGDGWSVRPAMRYRARGYYALDLARKAIDREQACIRNGHARLRQLRSAMAIEWRAAA